VQVAQWIAQRLLNFILMGG
jgi:hypothetical protein